VVGLGVAGVGAWLWLIGDLYAAQRIAPDADPGRQTAFILVDPIRFGRLLLADLTHNGAAYLWQGLGYAGTASPVIAWSHLAVLIVVALLDGRADVSLDRRGRGLIVAVAAATYALVTTTNYLAWNPVGAATVSFVQGRYYIPIAPLPLLLLSNRRLASLVPAPCLTAVAASAALLFAGVAVRNLFQRWYG
jgi:uncharacterized membrane protein